MCDTAPAICLHDHKGNIDDQAFQRGIVAAAALILLAQADAVFAGPAGPVVGNLAYIPSPLSVPTLSGWTVILLGLLFAVIAFRVMRTRNAGRPAASIVAAGVIALGAVSGTKMIQDAHAGTTPVPIVINASASLPFGPSESVFTNNTNVHQQIVSVTITNNAYVFGILDPGKTPCTTLPLLAPGQMCYLNLVLNDG